MTTKSSINLLISKSQAYRSGYDKAIARNDAEAAAKWKDGYNRIRDQVNELKESL